MGQLLLAAAIIIGFLWALVVFPSFRVVAFILVLIVGGIILVAMKNAEEANKQAAIKKEQGRVTCEAEKKNREEANKKNWAIVLPTQIELRDPMLTPPSFGDRYNVTASVKNLSAVDITKLKMNVVAFDCPLDATKYGQCDIVGHQEKEFDLDIPKGEVRQIKGTVELPDVPTPRGKLSWLVRVVGVMVGSEPAGDLLAKYQGGCR